LEGVTLEIWRIVSQQRSTSGHASQSKNDEALLSSRKSSKGIVLVILTSALLTVPCFWLPQIESFDLCSHIYNAWLSRLITEHHAPGLWMAKQTTNILFDSVLASLAGWFGPKMAQRLAVGGSVLLFFWASFALISVLSKSRPWFLQPCLAVLSYGQIYHYGFFNFYDSLAFAFIALALLWEPRPLRCVLALPVLILSWSAHPLPALWAVAMAAYIYIARTGRRGFQIAFLYSSGAALLGVSLYERLTFADSAGRQAGIGRSLLSAFGWDQILAFNHPFLLLSYRTVELGMLVIFLFLLIQVLRRDRAFSIPLQLYALTCFAGLILPARKVYFSRAFLTPMGFIAERVSLVAAVFACAVIGSATPKVWQRAAIVGFAAIFFIVAYDDEHALTLLESKVNRLVSQVPPLERVAALLRYPGAANGFTENIVDRACVGHCFSYGNYEASTSQFRIRAAAGNGLILADPEESARLAEGRYLVQARDLPLHQIYPCGQQITDLCIRSLQAGELNGNIPAVATR
jgi:hypothetical protein